MIFSSWKDVLFIYFQQIYQIYLGLIHIIYLFVPGWDTLVLYTQGRRACGGAHSCISRSTLVVVAFRSRTKHTHTHSLMGSHVPPRAPDVANIVISMPTPRIHHNHHHYRCTFVQIYTHCTHTYHEMNCINIVRRLLWRIIAHKTKVVRDTELSIVYSSKYM